MTGRARPKAVLVLHLFHEDVAIDLLRRVRDLDADVDVIATGPRLSRTVASAFAELSRADWVETRNEGFDVAPFLSVLPLLRRRGYDLVGKLHTKQGNSGFGRRWREACFDALIGSKDGVARIVEAFETSPNLCVVGPAGLYLSAAANMTANAEGVQRLASMAFPLLALPSDWGFFAGTMFWTRLAHLKPFIRLSGTVSAWEDGGNKRDGGTAHAVERLFGLMSVVGSGSVGLVPEAGGPIRITREPGSPVEILEALARLGRPSPSPRLGRAERAFIVQTNPLLHYLTSRSAAADPHPLFASEWYARRNAIANNIAPLSDFVARGAMAPDPSPLFRAGSYVGRRPWLKRRDVNPLLHHAMEVDASGLGGDGDGPVETARPHSAPVDLFARAARRQQLRAFLRTNDDLSFAVKIGASRTSPTEWGDVHFAAGLANALGALGKDARVDYREDWHRRNDASDVVICLRGPVRYEPRPGAFNILWIISHPDQVSFEEMEAYDLVYVASDSFAGLLSRWVDVPVLSLLQSTDESRFAPSRVARPCGSLFFAGNSRGQDRPVVRWALELGLPLEVHGAGWKGIVPARSFGGERIPNAELPRRYAAAAAVLGDHWPAMVDFGFVSNRLFDVLAAGGTPVTDAFPAISRVLGSAPIQVGTREELEPAVAEARARPLPTRLAHAERVRRHHGFGARATTMLRDLRAFPSGLFKRSGSGRGPRVHLAYDAGDASTAWMVDRRLLGPLTTDHAGIGSLSTGGPADPVPPGTDLVIVVPGTTSRAGTWDALVEAARTRRIVVDTGALPSLLRRAPPRLQPLFASAWQVWWPGGDPAAGKVASTERNRIVPDSIDPRLWRDYHRPRQWEFAAAPLRCVVVARAGVDPATSAILEGALAGAEVDLTVVEASNAATGPWTSVPFPKGRSGYAAFARWLRAQHFHAGLCLGAGATARDADVAFLDFSAAGLLTVAPIALLGPKIAVRGLFVPVATDWSDLPAVLARLAASPAAYAGVAAASAEHVWQARTAASAGTLIKSLLKD
ncbi:MAG: hypothetical protein KIS68_01115 [Bauldia sp.]|nr:hypothetical protein [Bauldia sp.]